MKLSRSFYTQDTLTVAKALLGKYLVRNQNGIITIGRIVETEAYLGPKDKAAHSYKASPFGRTNVMYQEGGFAYVYFIYGMHYCFNVVSNQKEIPEAVLIRALEPVYGIDVMQKRRRQESIKNLTNGPGKLCQAMDITKELYGEDLLKDSLYIIYETDPLLKTLKIPSYPLLSEEQILCTKRINIQYAEEAKDFLYRFIIKDNPHLSVKKIPV